MTFRAWACGVAVGWSWVAGAVEVAPHDVPCPLGGAPTRVFALVSQNTHGGWDSDGARYSTGGQFRTYELATCPDNLLTLYGTDMAGTLSTAQEAALAPVLADVAEKVADPKKLTTWDRYAIAARCYTALDADPLQLARLYVKAGWTVRDEGVGVYEGLEGPSAVRAVLLAGPVELAKPLDPATERLVLLNLARVAHRGGYAYERDTWLTTLEERTDLTASDRASVERLKMAIAVEPLFQKQAVPLLEAYLAGSDGTPSQRVEARFLLADVQRRTGHPKEALAGYRLVLADPAAPDQLVELSQWLAAELEGERPWESGTTLRPPGP